MESAFHDHAAQHRPTPTLDLCGLIPATVAPMTATGELDLPALRHYLQWIAAQGPVALAVTADTAQVAQLRHDEQVRVVEVAKDATDLPCIAGVGATDPAQAAKRAVALKEAGADALLVFSHPHLDVVDYHRAIGESGLPLIAFQLQPSLGGVLYPPDLLRRLLEVPAVVALKEASFDRERFRATAAFVAQVDGVTLLTGNDNFILESFELGARGALLGFGAMMTAAQVAMIEAWQEGRAEDARRLAARLQPLADAVFAPPVNDYRARLKECLVILGILPAAHVRAPLRAIGDDERARLRRAIETAIGVPA